MKKTLRMLLTLSLLVLTITVCCTISAFALTDGNWEFQLVDNEATVTGYTGTETDVHIPATLYGVPVTKVECPKWKECFKTAESITFPATVKVVQHNGWGKNLKAAYLPLGVETIKGDAFAGCKNLSTVTLPSTLTEIGRQAFLSCSALTNVEFPASLQTIGYAAFCETGLVTADLSKCNVQLGRRMLANCKSLETVVLNPNTTEIPEQFCLNNSKLKNIDIPANVSVIGFNAFEGCAALENIILPTGLKTLRHFAFSGTGLTEVVVPYGTTEIQGAFRNMPTLLSLYIPDTVTKMDTGIISGSPNCIIFCSQNSPLVETLKKHQISYLTDSSVNSGITVIYNGKRISFHAYGQNPQIMEGRTLVPLRSIFEKMGAEVQWDGTTYTATAKRGNVEIKIQIGSNVLTKNGQAMTVDVPAQLIGGRTMVPVRVIAEAFAADVKWNANGKTVLISE